MSPGPPRSNLTDCFLHVQVAHRAAFSPHKALSPSFCAAAQRSPGSRLAAASILLFLKKDQDLEVEMIAKSGQESVALKGHAHLVTLTVPSVL